MDSKIRRMAISAAAAVILLVSILVIYTNRDKDSVKSGSSSGAGDIQPDVTTEVASNGQIGNDLKGFLRDETFFDQETDSVLEALLDDSNRLTIMANSVERDIRVQIMNMDGELVTGESFFINVSGLGEYKDLDQDGIVYIADVSPGEYDVTLKPIDGYRVPAGEISIRVKDKIEYVAIEDISILIKTEAEVDAEAEDSRVSEALEDTDGTEIKEVQHTTGRTKFGIDVSKWNGDIDWEKVKASGVEFAIIRAGYRGSVTGSIIEDPYFKTNMEKAKAAGVLCGVYFFTQATNEVEAVEEASAVLSLISEYEGLDLPIYIDTEGAGGNGRADAIDVDTRTTVCEAFCQTIENAGYKSGVYASRNWLYNNLNVDRLDKFNTWLAEYRSTPLYTGYFQMWQYTSKGKIDGIKGYVDLDLCYE